MGCFGVWVGGGGYFIDLRETVMLFPSVIAVTIGQITAVVFVVNGD